MTASTYATGTSTPGVTEVANYYNQQGGSIVEQLTGGSLSWEANNPGDIRAPSYAAAVANLAYWDAIGVYTYNAAGGQTSYFYIFPSYQTGLQQLQLVLEGSIYQQYTVGQACQNWTALAAGSSTLQNYEAKVLQNIGAGVTASTPMTSLSPTQIDNMALGIQYAEGWFTGQTSQPSTSPPAAENPILALAQAQLGTRWGDENCTGFVFTIAAEAGAPFFYSPGLTDGYHVDYLTELGPDGARVQPGLLNDSKSSNDNQGFIEPVTVPPGILTASGTIPVSDLSKVTARPDTYDSNWTLVNGDASTGYFSASNTVPQPGELFRGVAENARIGHGTLILHSGVVQSYDAVTHTLVLISNWENGLIATDTFRLVDTWQAPDGGEPFIIDTKSTFYRLNSFGPTQITGSPTVSTSNGLYTVGTSITITVNTSAPVSLSGGNPVLNLDNGRTAAYLSGSGSATLKFVYTVAAGDDITTLGVTAFNSGGATIEDGSGNPAALINVSGTFAGLGVDTTPPTVSSPAITVGTNTGQVAIGIAAPSDNANLTIKVIGLPTDGTVFLSDGVTTVAQNQALSVNQLTGLRFAPTPNLSGKNSTFTYLVTDSAGNSSIGTAALAIASATEVPSGIFDPLVETGNTRLDTSVFLDHNTGSHAVLENAGTLTVELGGSVTSDGSPGDMVLNDQGAEFNVDAPTLFGEMIPFQNNGLLVISPGDGNTAKFTSYVNAPVVAFANTGTVHIESGAFDVDRGGTSNASSFAIDSDATLLITGASSAPPFTFAGGTYNVVGTTEVGDASGHDGYLTFGSGTTVDAGSPWLINESVDMSAATVVGTFTDLVLTPFGGRGLLNLGNNSVTINGLRAYDSNIVSTTGTITLTGVSLAQDTSHDGGDYTNPWTVHAINNEGILTLDHEVLDQTDFDSGSVFNNSSTVNIEGGGIISDLQNYQNATMNVTNGSVLEGPINNAGTLNLDGTSGFLRVQGKIVNTGTILEAGTIYFSGGLINDGVIEGSDAVSGNSVAITIGKDAAVAGALVQSQSGTATLTNTGLIDAATGLVVDPSDPDNITVTNSSIITGTSGTAVQFGLGNDLLILDPGSAMIGKVDGGTGNNTIELAAGSGSGAVSGIGSNFVNFSTVTVDSGAEWQVGVAIGTLPDETITGDGLSSLALEGAGAADLSQVTGFANIYLDPSDTDSATLADANFVGTSGVVSVSGGNADDANGDAGPTAGGSGIDTVVFSNSRSNYQIAYTDGGLAISDAAGTDLVTNIQTLQFSDMTLATLDSNATAAVAQFDDTTGTGHIFIQSGTTVSAGIGSAFAPAGLDLGGTAGGEGDASAQGVGALLSNVGQFVVGDAAVGSLSVLSGASVTTAPGTGSSLPGAIIADTSGASGSSVNVTGAGSDWQVGGSLVVGEAGSGQLSITQNGTVTVAALDAGAVVGGSGVISVVGTGAPVTNAPISTLAVTGALTVGDKAAGSLTILNGGFVSTADLDVGTSTGGASNVVIGKGSELKSTGTVNLGTASLGVLMVEGTLALTNSINQGGFGHLSVIGGLLDAAPTQDISKNFSLSAGGADEVWQAFFNSGSGPSEPIVTAGSGTLLAPLLTHATSKATGTIDVEQSGTLVLDVNTVDASQTISFGDNTGALVIGQQVTIDATNTPQTIAAAALSGFSGVIAGYATGNAIVVETTVAAGFVNPGSGATIAVRDLVSGQATGALEGTLVFSDAASAAAAFADLGQTVPSLQDQLIPCFVAGTLIETVAGPRAVETLREGDEVRTILGGPGRIGWIGTRTVNCARHPRPEKVWPIRVRRNAFGPGLPERDLFLSPDHAVYVRGVLIPVHLLVNGTTVRQVERASVAYYHVELAQHDVVLAEGLPAETYLDTGDRSHFINGGGVMSLYPEFGAGRRSDETARVWEMAGCAPLVLTGETLTATRASLAEWETYDQQASPNRPRFITSA